VNENAREAQMVFWHRQLPPIGAEALGEHVVEAASDRVAGTIAHRDELWEHCHAQLMTRVRTRLEQEVIRLGGRYAHVLDERIESRRDEAAGEAWLQGRVTYVLYQAGP
jgi:hypothetical protein